MPQQTIFPIRFGLQVPRGESFQAVEVFSEGGLDLTQSVIENRPGCASQLINFEISLTGGYRRISGFSPYSSVEVPGTGPILGAFVFFNGQVLAARQDVNDLTSYIIYSGTGSSWTQISPPTQIISGHVTNGSTTITNIADTSTLAVGQKISDGLTFIPANTLITAIVDLNTITISNAATGTITVDHLTVFNPFLFKTGMVITAKQHNWTGTNVIVFTDGVNPASMWDGTKFTVLSTPGAAVDPLYNHVFEGYLFVAGYSSNKGAIKYSAPLSENDWLPIDGAAEIVIGDTITGLASWRNQLIIFCNKSIHSLQFATFNTPNVQPITTKIGCQEGRSIQELDGDLVYLSNDGIRTISGTFNIGDTEIASISRPIQSIVSNINPQLTPVHSLVVDKKTQYRLYYPSPAEIDEGAPGIIGGIRRFRNGSEGWEWGELRGVKPYCCHSGYMNDGQEYVIHGGYDGFVYKHEQIGPGLGGTFNGSPINEAYTTVPLELGDYGTRKVIHRVTIYTVIERAGTVNLYLKLIYDLNNVSTLQPPNYLLTGIGGGTARYDSGALYDDDVAYNSMGNAAFRQLVQGSGFLTSLFIGTQAGMTSNPYTIQGFYIEYFPAGRR